MNQYGGRVASFLLHSVGDVYAHFAYEESTPIVGWWYAQGEFQSVYGNTDEPIGDLETYLFDLWTGITRLRHVDMDDKTFSVYHPRT